MFSTKSPAKISGLIFLILLLAASFRVPRSAGRTELLLLMEPDGTGVWHDIIERFNHAYPGTPVRLVEGPPSTDTREDMYSTAFLAGQSARHPMLAVVGDFNIRGGIKSVITAAGMLGTSKITHSLTVRAVLPIA